MRLWTTDFLLRSPIAVNTDFASQIASMFLAEKEFVFNACITDFHRPLVNDNHFCFFHFQDKAYHKSGNRGLFCSRIYNIVNANYRTTSVDLNSSLACSISKQFIITHIGLGNGTFVICLAYGLPRDESYICFLYAFFFQRHPVHGHTCWACATASPYPERSLLAHNS